MLIVPILTSVYFLCAGRSFCDSLENFEPNVDGDSQLLIGRHKRDASQVPECKDGYEKIDGNTMCKPDSPEYIKGTAGVSDTDRKLILELHNHFRSVVEPTAKQMLKLYWDDELAKTAEKWAKQCTSGHNKPHERYIPKYKSVPGQNGGYQWGNWTKVVDAWHNESQMFIFGRDPAKYLDRGIKDIGHYSMMMVDRAILIGCGFARCNSSLVERYYFCHYLAGPKIVAHPYKPGYSCAGCPDNCTNTLCDCGNRYCFNKGKLNLRNCTCECPVPWKGDRCMEDICKGHRCKHYGKLKDTCECECPYPYHGDSCEEKRCELKPDPHKCLRKKVQYCSSSLVKMDCPMLCNVCPDYCPGLRCANGRKNASNCECIYPCDRKNCINGGRLNLKTCLCECQYPYIGDKCETKNCTGKADDNFCKTHWPLYMCYLKPIKLKCPVLCGVCRGSCPNVNCWNNGKKLRNCSCSCKYPFSGKRCEIKKCVKKLDPKPCGSRWPEAFCKRFSNVRAFCPAMCGICAPVCGGKLCKNGGKLYPHTCMCKCRDKYAGETCEKLLCNGKRCMNYGALDRITCQCRCHPNYSGRICEKWTCPKYDAKECGKGAMRLFQCYIRQDVSYRCPHMCKQCPTRWNQP